jgi:hypothetical protein
MQFETYSAVNFMEAETNPMILPTAFIKLENKNKVWVLSVHE